jgi:hypothetical protein
MDMAAKAVGAGEWATRAAGATQDGSRQDSLK